MAVRSSEVLQTPIESKSGFKTGLRSMHRTLGLIGMITSPFFFASVGTDGFSNGDASQTGAALGLVFALGWLSNVAGLWSFDAAGRRVSKYLLGIQLFTVSMAAVFQVYEFVSPGNDSVLYTIADICWPLSMLLLLITGIFAARARVLLGILRFAPLFAALWLPASAVGVGLLGESGGLAVGGTHTAIGWFIMGFAVYRGRQSAVRS